MSHPVGARVGDFCTLTGMIQDLQLAEGTKAEIRGTKHIAPDAGGSPSVYYELKVKTEEPKKTVKLFGIVNV